MEFQTSVAEGKTLHCHEVCLRLTIQDAKHDKSGAYCWCCRLAPKTNTNKWYRHWLKTANNNSFSTQLIDEVSEEFSVTFHGGSVSPRANLALAAGMLTLAASWHFRLLNTFLLLKLSDVFCVLSGFFVFVFFSGETLCILHYKRILQKSVC